MKMLTTLLFLFLLSASALAKDVTLSPRSGATFTAVTSDQPNTITFSFGVENGADNYVRLNPNGTIEYGKDYHPDKGAKEFWDLIISMYPLCTAIPRTGDR
jgi:hypothetical protein